MRYSLVIDVVSDNEKVVVAKLRYFDEEGEIEEVASASCDPHDEFDYQTGVNLAVGRVTRQLGRTLLAEAQSKVREADRRRRKQEEANRLAREQRERRARTAKARATRLAKAKAKANG